MPQHRFWMWGVCGVCLSVLLGCASTPSVRRSGATVLTSSEGSALRGAYRPVSLITDTTLSRSSDVEQDTREGLPDAVTADDSLDVTDDAALPGMTKLLDGVDADMTTNAVDALQPDPSAFDIPIVLNDRVKESIHFLRTRMYTKFSEWLNRANRYTPMMRAIFKREGLPGDLVYVSLIESGYQPRAYSSAKAAGLWQFIVTTGQERGLARNQWVDERFDPEKSTRAIMKHFKILHKMFGSWELVMAAHNAGPGRIQKVIQKSGSTDYWQLALPAETMKFVPLIMAAAIIAKNPGPYGFTVQSAPPLTYETVDIALGWPLSTIADGMNISLDDLKLLNPELRQWKLPPTGYALKIPVGTRPNVLAWLERPGKSVPRPVVQRAGSIHIVRSGDTVGKLARVFNVTPTALMAANRIKRPQQLKIGLALVIPGTDASPIARTSTPVPTPTVSQVVPDVPVGVTYTVRTGDTMSALAERYRVSMMALLRANNLTRPERLKTGQTLTIPVQSESSPDAPPRVAAVSTPAAPVAVSLPIQESTTPPAAFHTVQPGETLSGIARQYKMTLASLIERNDLAPPYALKPRQTLAIQGTSPLKSPPTRMLELASTALPPVTSPGNQDGVTYTVRSGDTIYGIARRFQVTPTAIITQNSLSPPHRVKPGQMLVLPWNPTSRPATATDTRIARVQDTSSKVSYRVKRGDTLDSISKRYNVPISEIQRWNRLKTAKRIKKGQTLTIWLSDAGLPHNSTHPAQDGQ